MDDASDVALRMRDVIFALRAAEEYNETLNRIRLQKFVYLLDVVAILYDLFPTADGHVTYKNGPYDSTIQNAVDALAFRGFVQVVSSHSTPHGSVSSEYALSAAGRAWCDRLAAESRLQARWIAAKDVADRVNYFGWPRLVQLVYSEPTFVVARNGGVGQRLRPAAPGGASASNLLRCFRYALGQRRDAAQVSRQVLLDLFFRYLDQYARRIGERVT